MRVLLVVTPTYAHPVVLLPPPHSRKSADSLFPVVRNEGMQRFSPSVASVHEPLLEDSEMCPDTLWKLRGGKKKRFLTISLEWDTF